MKRHFNFGNQKSKMLVIVRELLKGSSKDQKSNK
jgi:hypothetical protein